MSDTTSVLPDVKARLIELLDASLTLADVDVRWASPGSEIERETIYFGRTSGTSAIANMRAGRKARDETCQVTVIIRTAIPGRDAEEADRRATDLYAVLEDVCANDIALVGAQGDDIARLQRIDGVLSVEMTSYETGPEGDLEGYIGVIAAVVSVTARLN